MGAARHRGIWGFIAFAVGFGLSISPAIAQMSEDDYLAALKIAGEYVKHKKELQDRSNALSPTLIRSLYGKYYEVGDTWEIAAMHIVNPMARMTSNPDHLKPTSGGVGIFRYTVTDVKTGVSPEIHVKITQVADYGYGPVDANVSQVNLVMNDQLIQLKRQPIFISRPDRLQTALEVYPLDIPDVGTADQKEATSMPELPDALKPLARRVGYGVDLRKSSWFDQDDAFGRPVEFLWQEKDPWPAYLKTVNGVAILIRKGA